MAMAAVLRAVLKKVRPLPLGRHQQLKGSKLGFMGAISNFSIIGNNPSYLNNYYNTALPSSSCWRRHYFLPPPPPPAFDDSPSFLDVCYRDGIYPVEEAEIDSGAIKSAEFAVKIHNQEALLRSVGREKDDGDGVEEIRFVRVVRASVSPRKGPMYYITLEALRGKADMNVYYAEVLHRPDQNQPGDQNLRELMDFLDQNKQLIPHHPDQSMMELIKWELVDESFSYPFEEVRLSEFLAKQFRRERVARNSLVRNWLTAMEQLCRNVEKSRWRWGSTKGETDSKDTPTQNPSSVVLKANECPPTPPENFVNLGRTVTRSIVLVFDIKTFEMVYKYAMFAVAAQYQNEGIRLHLKDVLCARKSKVSDGWVFEIVLEAINGQNKVENFYAIVLSTSLGLLKLIKWHQIGESFCYPDAKQLDTQDLVKHFIPSPVAVAPVANIT
ncbi:hypothetical protein ACH5RR_019184 [Cinchona calisaya]|uniref:Uncharacterized protein n=1 Tax=Cinchona calisaya TaxID=153742 RepID=A0ABD2ZRS4_9GENT